MTEALRWYFLTIYCIGIVILLLRLVPAAFKDMPVERQPKGLQRYLPAFFIPFTWLIPPVLILLRIGELQAEWPVVRLLGVVLSLYAAVMLLWAQPALGRFLVPYAAVFKDHQLITSGPFRLVRHPIYSGVLALTLGAGLGTLNGFLVILWPLVALAISVQAGSEEALLQTKFGASYDDYARRTGRFIPSVGVR
jgi:protein-S-isoprenylcysteine O-methyltransferase Ste14